MGGTRLDVKTEIVLLGVYLANDLHDNAGFPKKVNRAGISRGCLV